MLNIENWTMATIDRLVRDGIGESLVLDYKASPALTLPNDKAKDELCKDVAAFANSAGGVIVFGVEEKGGIPVRRDDGVDFTTVTADRIENILHSRIAPRVDGLRIFPVPFASPTQGGYVIRVPQATSRAPHQANFRYYKRFERKAQAMEDYEVRDILRRQTTADLSYSLAIRPHPHPGEDVDVFRVTAECLNSSETPSHHSAHFMLVDKSIFRNKPFGLEAGEVERAIDGTERTFIGWRTLYAAQGGSLPLFREMATIMADFEIQVHRSSPGGWLITDVRAPGCHKEQVFRLDRHAATLVAREIDA